MKFNEKGFTLTELLVAVIILGIISSIVIVSVVKVMNKSHIEYAKKQNELLTEVAQNYFSDNREKLQKNILGTSSISLATLEYEKYIDKIVDYKKKNFINIRVWQK